MHSQQPLRYWRYNRYSATTAVPICSESNSGNTYQWSAVNGAIVSGQGTNIASVMWSQDTIGSLSVVESNGYCTDTAHLAIRTHIGLEELLADQLMIYPKPFSRTSNIRVNTVLV